MTDTETRTLVFKDEAGDYYLLPRETLERGRVPAEHTVEVERLLAETNADVAGYMVSTAYTLFRVLNMGAKAIGDMTAGAAEDTGVLQWLGEQINSGGKA